jgi:hypothetical protein
MNKNELKENTAKITQILQSENYENGFELLKTINDPQLNEALADLIQSTVKERYFEQDNVDEGLDILRILSPTLTSLDLSGSYVEELDLTKFISLQELNLSYCNELHTVKGLERLDKLTSLNCVSTSSLVDLDVYELDCLPDVIGLRTKYGMHYGGNIQASEETWWDYLDEFLNDAEEYCGVVTILCIDESDFYDEIFSRWRCSGPKSIDLSTRDKLGIWLNKERLESRFSEDSDIWPSQDEASVALFTSGWDFITSFKKHRNDFTIDCDECLETFTIGETVQVDDEDESIRCCSDCSNKRNNKQSEKIKMPENINLGHILSYIYFDFATSDIFGEKKEKNLLRYIDSWGGEEASMTNRDLGIGDTFLIPNQEILTILDKMLWWLGGLNAYKNIKVTVSQAYE